MFVCSVRASTVKFFAVLVLCLVVLFGVVIGNQTVSASAEGGSSVNFSGIKTDEDRRAFIESFGYKVKSAEASSADFLLPENFDRVMLGYNEIQKTQGLDLSKYVKKKVTRYSYELESYEGYEGAVFANLFVYRGKVIGCDVSTADPSGFVKPMVSI